MRRMVRWSWLAGLMAVALSAVLATAAIGDSARTSKPVVVDDGVAPDGTPYRHVLFHKAFSYRVNGGKKKVVFTGWCKEFRLLSDPPLTNGGHCDGDTGPQPSPESIPAITTSGVGLVTPGKADSDVYLVGETSSKVERVRVVYTDPNGVEQDLAVDFAKFEGARAAKVGKRMKAKSRKARRAARGKRRGRKAQRIATVRPYGVYTAFLPGEISVRDDLAQRAKGGDEGDPNQAGHDPVKSGNFNGLAWDGNPCDSAVGPFRVIAYDADGHELEADPCGGRAPRAAAN
jgi:hypothetical protein